MAKQIDKFMLEMIRRDLQEAVKAVEEKYNINLRCGDVRYTSLTATMNLEISLRKEDGFDPGLEAWRTSTVFTSFLEEDYGKTIELDGKPYKIIGYNRKARSNSVQLEGPDGKTYVAHNEAVLQALGRGPSEEQMRTSFNHNIRMFGLDAQYGDIYLIAGKRYKLVKIKLSSRKYPIVAIDMSDNKEIALAVDFLKAGRKENK